MRDGLYFNGRHIAEVSTALTFQINDLTKPDSLNTSYSLNFNLPDTLLIRDVLGGAEQPDAGGVYPYALPEAKLISSGEVLFDGLARLESFQAGWKVSLITRERDLFTRLSEIKLRELDLSRFDHPWNVATISALAGRTSGVVYPLVDYGAFDGSAFADDSLFPAVYAFTLIEIMLTRIGYRAAGQWLNDELLKRVAVAFVEEEPNAQDPEWVAARTARVTIANPIPYTGQNRRVDTILPFTVDNREADGYTDGTANNYDATGSRYRCDVDMRLRVQASLGYGITVTYGGAEIKLIIEKNGANVYEEYVGHGGPYNITGTKRDRITLDETVICRAGDVIQIRFIVDKRTFLASYSLGALLLPDEVWASFTPDANVGRNDIWRVARNLPDMTCAELLKSVALFCSGSFLVDNRKGTLTLVRLDEITNATAAAVDWSAYVDESSEPELVTSLEPYGQKNLLAWAELEGVSPYGNGSIKSPAANLPPVAELFTLPFAACSNSPTELPGYGFAPLIRTRSYSGKAGDTEIQKEPTTPRLLLIEPSKTVSVTANVLTPDKTVRPSPVTLTAAWWGERPAGAKTSDNVFSLAFDRVTPAQREQVLTARYFSGLVRVLRRPRFLTLPMLLPADVVADVQTASGVPVPIRINEVRAGSLVISNAYCYLNKISNYADGQPGPVSLIIYF